MIVQIRGTSGSGKSYVMRRVMELMGDWEPIRVDGRKQPLYYRSSSDWSSMVVVGHYESPCGGCDTIGSAKSVYNLLTIVLRDEQRVLCEGLLLSEDVKWTSQLKEVRVVFLTTPLDVCLAQIEKRRKGAGNDKPLNPKNTANRIAVIERARVKLTEAGVYCRRASADQAPELILGWLKV